MKKIHSLLNFFLNEKFKEKSEYVIIYISIFAFIVHLIFFFLNKLDFIHLELLTKLFNNPIAAIYTPFSFILIYEVYLLVYYLPKSTTIYIGKQYEIILLISSNLYNKVFTEKKLVFIQLMKLYRDKNTKIGINKEAILFLV